MKKEDRKKPKTVNGISVVYSPMNVAWFVLWKDQVLRIFNDRHDLDYYLKFDLGITNIHVPRGHGTRR